LIHEHDGSIAEIHDKHEQTVREMSNSDTPVMNQLQEQVKHLKEELNQTKQEHQKLIDNILDAHEEEFQKRNQKAQM